MNEEFKDRLRHLNLGVIRILLLLCMTESFALEVNEISKSTSTAEPKLKGVISALRRVKYKEKSIIIPAGRDSKGSLRWKIDDSIINKKELSDFIINEILGEDD